MSAICGVYSPADPSLASPEYLSRLMAAMSHRGGDGEATFFAAADGVALGHLYRANFRRPDDVPTPAFVKDGAAVAILDGQLSNLHALAGGELASPGNREARALLRLYRSDRESFPEGIEGYLAAAIWDGDRKALTLVEDPLGRKPLWYYHDAARRLLVFASELKAVLAHPAVPRAVDEEALSLYLSIGDVPAPFTMIKGAKKVRPGRRLTFTAAGEAKEWRYWLLAPQEKGPDAVADWLPPVREELENAIARVTSGSRRVALFSAAVSIRPSSSRPLPLRRTSSSRPSPSASATTRALTTYRGPGWPPGRPAARTRCYS